MAAETQPSLADAEAYVLDFVRARRERHSAAHILSEFHIPADAWPSDPEALTLAALASLVLCWVRGNADARADGPALRAVATHPTCWQPAAATAVMVAELGEGRDGVVVLDGDLGHVLGGGSNMSAIHSSCKFIHELVVEKLRNFSIFPLIISN